MSTETVNDEQVAFAMPTTHQEWEEYFDEIGVSIGGPEAVTPSALTEQMAADGIIVGSGASNPNENDGMVFSSNTPSVPINPMNDAEWEAYFAEMGVIISSSDSPAGEDDGMIFGSSAPSLANEAVESTTVQSATLAQTPTIALNDEPVTSAMPTMNQDHFDDIEEDGVYSIKTHNQEELFDGMTENEVFGFGNSQPTDTQSTNDINAFVNAEMERMGMTKEEYEERAFGDSALFG